MASGGGDGPKKDNEEDPFRRRRRGSDPRRRPLTRDVISDQSRFLLNRFVHDRMEADGMEVPREEDFYAPSTPRGNAVPENERLAELAKCLRNIGDELDGVYELQNLIGGLNPRDAKNNFRSIAVKLFEDGQYNWGRILTLFYLAYKMAKKAAGAVDVVITVVEWVVTFIRDRLAEWIIGRGGWEAITEYFQPHNVQTAFVIIAGILTAAFFVRYKR